MLLTGKKKTEITIETPKGISYTAQILQIDRNENAVSCAVEKNGGDDPDITSGTLIYAKVAFGKKTKENKANEKEFPRQSRDLISQSEMRRLIMFHGK